MNFLYKSNKRKSKSYGILKNSKYNNERYLRNNTNFINYHIPYEQEKLIKRIENAKNRKKWMNHNGFFTNANIKSLNSIISPKLHIHKVKIKKIHERKSKRIFLSDINNSDQEKD